MDKITFDGNREAWIDFSTAVKRQKKKIWEVLGPILKRWVEKQDEVK